MVKHVSSRDRRLEEFLCHLIFKVSCSLAPYVVKIGCDIRILLWRLERVKDQEGHQPRIWGSRCERVGQQNISRQITHESVRIELSSGTTLSMIYTWDAVSFESKNKRNEKCDVMFRDDIQCRQWRGLTVIKMQKKNCHVKLRRHHGDLEI